MVLLVNYLESMLQLFSSYPFLFSTKTRYFVFNIFFHSIHFCEGSYMYEFHSLYYNQSSSMKILFFCFLVNILSKDHRPRDVYFAHYIKENIF